MRASASLSWRQWRAALPCSPPRPPASPKRRATPPTCSTRSTSTAWRRRWRGWPTTRNAARNCGGVGSRRPPGSPGSGRHGLCSRPMRTQERSREVGVTVRQPGLADDYAVLSRSGAARRVAGLPLLVWLLIDTALINLSFVAAYVARYPLGLGGRVAPENWSTLHAYWQIQLWFWAFLIVLLQVEGIYRRRRQTATFDQLGIIVRSTILTGGIIAALSFVLRPPSQSRFIFLYMVVAAIITLGLARLVVRAVQVARYRRGFDVRNVLVVGESNVAKMLLQRI